MDERQRTGATAPTRPGPARSWSRRPRRPSPPRSGPGAAQAPVVAGLSLCRPRWPAGGPPWRARETATGRELLLRAWPDGGCAELLDDLPEHPHLLPARAVRDAAGVTLLASRTAAHGGLDALLGRRGSLCPGEAVTVVVGIGGALAALHAAGRTHGAVGAATVLLVDGARPVLDGRALVQPGTVHGDAAEDVRALGALVTDALGGPALVPAGLRPALSAATDPVPGLRPDAAGLTRQVLAAVPAEPLRPGRAEPAASAPRTGRAALVRAQSGRPVRARVPSRPRGHAGAPVPGRVRAVLWPAAATVAALALAVLAGTAWAWICDSAPPEQGLAVPVPPGARSAASSPAAVVIPAAATQPPGVPAASPGWAGVLGALDLRRAAAFAGADTGMLATVDAPGSPAMSADRAAVRALAAAGLQVRGYRVQILQVRAERVAVGAALLWVSDVRTGYQLVAGGHRVVAARSGRAAAQWTVALVCVAGRWLVSSVRTG